MRHNKKINHLGRKTAHRKAMLSNMASSLIVHKRIETTVAKAKALKIYVEPLITRSKDDSTHSRRVVFSHLQDKEAVSALFREVGAKVADRPGGYTRIIKLGRRLGDNAEMCIIELVDFNETLLAEKAASKKTASRRRRGAKKTEASAEVAAPAAAETEAVAEAVAEEPVAEETVVEEPVAEEAVAEEAVAEEPVAEVVAEEPVAEAVAEEPVAEAVAEEPVATAEEVQEEEPKAEEDKEEDKKEEKKD